MLLALSFTGEIARPELLSTASLSLEVDVVVATVERLKGANKLVMIEESNMLPFRCCEALLDVGGERGTPPLAGDDSEAEGDVRTGVESTLEASTRLLTLLPLSGAVKLGTVVAGSAAADDNDDAAAGVARREMAAIVAEAEADSFTRVEGTGAALGVFLK